MWRILADELQVVNSLTCYYGFSYKLENYEKPLKQYVFSSIHEIESYAQWL
jgi:hypothetical protein